jgi:hypothetical protein
MYSTFGRDDRMLLHRAANSYRLFRIIFMSILLSDYRLIDIFYQPNIRTMRADRFCTYSLHQHSYVDRFLAHNMSIPTNNTIFHTLTKIAFFFVVPSTNFLIAWKWSLRPSDDLNQSLFLLRLYTTNLHNNYWSFNQIRKNQLKNQRLPFDWLFDEYVVCMRIIFISCT